MPATARRKPPKFATDIKGNRRGDDPGARAWYQTEGWLEEIGESKG